MNIRMYSMPFNDAGSLLSGGGFGFTIGKEKQRDEYANQNSEQIGSTIGSVEGSVNLHAQGDANIKGSEIIAGKNITISGENVNIANTDSVYNAQERHEFERSGLSVSLGGDIVDAANTIIAPLERAHQVQDDRLSALYGVKAGTEIKDIAGGVKNQKNLVDNLQKQADAANKALSEAISNNVTGEALKELQTNADIANKQLDKAKNDKYSGNNDFNVKISIGTTKSKSESESSTVIAQGSNVQAGGNVTITSTEKDINIKGSNIEGENVSLNAKENLNITASENTNVTKQDSKSSSGSIGVTVGAGGLQGINAGYSQSQGNVKENSTAYNESSVTANKDLSFTSGSDTNIQGGKLSGEKVTGSVGGDLNIESKQDGSSYEEQSRSAGLTLDYSIGSHKIGIGGGVSSSNIDSQYSSVTEQSGIYAGEEGFDIYVGSNTDLKGGVIASEAEAENNKISTGTLTWEDIHNKAEYEASGIGANVNIDNGANYNEKGVTPNIGMPAADEAESTTKAAIAEGTIKIRDKENQKQDVSQLNRDTQNSLNKLGEIFDKDSIKERQELAGLFGELAYKAVGDLAIKNGWAEGSAEKNALHALIGGIMSELGGSGFLAGASGAMVNEMIQDKLSELFKDDPAMHQWASALIGGVVSEIVANNAQAGASTAASGTKNNILSHEQNEKHDEEVSEVANDRNSTGEIKDKQEYWVKVDKEQQEQLVNKLNDPAYIERLDAALKENPNLTEFEGVVVKGKDLYGNVIDATNPINREMIAQGTNAFVKSMVENGITGLPSSLIETINGSSGNIQSLKGTPIYNSLKAAGITVDAVIIGNVLYTDITEFKGKDIYIAIAYDTIGIGMGYVSGFAGGAAGGLLTGGPIGMGVGMIAGSALGGAMGSNWADERKAELKK